jgi:hypothetical protein
MAFEPPPTQAVSASGRRPNCGKHLRTRLAAHHGIEIAHHHRIRMRTCHGADDVEGVGDIRDPVAHGLVERILECLRTGLVTGTTSAPSSFMR